MGVSNDPPPKEDQCSARRPGLRYWGGALIFEGRHDVSIVDVGAMLAAAGLVVAGGWLPVRRPWLGWALLLSTAWSVTGIVLGVTRVLTTWHPILIAAGNVAGLVLLYRRQLARRRELAAETAARWDADLAEYRERHRRAFAEGEDPEHFGRGGS